MGGYGEIEEEGRALKTRMKRFLDILSKKRIFRILSKKRVFCCVFSLDIFFSRITAFHSKVHFFKSSKLDTLSPHAGCFRVLAPKSQPPSPKTRDASGLKRFFTHPRAEDLFVTEAQTMHSGGSRSVFSCKRPSARRLT